MDKSAARGVGASASVAGAGFSRPVRYSTSQRQCCARGRTMAPKRFRSETQTPRGCSRGAARNVPRCARFVSRMGAQNASQSDARVFGAFALAAVCWAACVAAQWASVDAAAARWGLKTTPAAVPGFAYGQTVLVFLLAAFYSLVDATARPERRDKAIGAVYVSLVCSAFYAAVAATRVPCFLQPWGARLVPARYITWGFTNPLVRYAFVSSHHFC